MTDINLIKGDCLTESSRIESGSVELILCDPPYGTMRGAQLDGWGDAKTAWDTAIEPADLFDIANRILRRNGKLVLFSQEPYTSRLITEAIPNIPFSYRMIWEKDHFANSLIAKKAPVSYFEDVLIFSKTHDTDDLHPLRDYFKQCKQKSGMTNREFNYLFSDYYGKTENRDRSVLEHYWQSSQFTIPTREIYEDILRPTGFFPLDYESLYEIDAKFKKNYASVFNLWEGGKHKSNILRYKKDYDGFHPTQKPVLLLEDLIKTYSNEGDRVVDLTMGSGSTGVACVNTGRSFTGIEMDEGYFDIAERRINECLADTGIK